MTRPNQALQLSTRTTEPSLQPLTPSQELHVLARRVSDWSSEFRRTIAATSSGTPPSFSATSGISATTSAAPFSGSATNITTLVEA